MGNFESVSLMPSEERLFFFFSFQYRMKREGNEIWRFKEAGSERGRIILDGWRRGGEWRRVEDEDALK